MELRYELWDRLPPEPLQSSLLDLLSSVFTSQLPASILADIHYHLTRTGLQFWLAIDNQQIVGCKLGYERKPGQFYSWLGCVQPALRGHGIAGELMRQQHEWCRQRSYHTIRTETYNQWRTMLILNLRFGFNIIGTVQGKHGLTIVLEKKL
ncbi:GNAT family N-acetyltransferase [Spirosoma sp. SC4-14]|uniref:GNAT family N-acetyltransferase n=1 Tax=Spirosoma sp. SC4-14 TaxID=3128900 RepID=UPI0030CCEFBA